MPRSPEFDTAIFDRATEYEIIARWWRELGVAVLPRRAMPRFGVWAICEDVRVAAAFAFNTTSELSIMAFSVADPTLPDAMQAQATAYAIEQTHKLLREAKPDGVIISLCHSLSTHQTYVKRAGFRGTGKTWIGVSAPDDVNLDLLTE